MNGPSGCVASLALAFGLMAPGASGGAEDGGRYYQPVVDTYQDAPAILEESDYHLEFADARSAMEGLDVIRLDEEHDLHYLYSTSTAPACEDDLPGSLKRFEEQHRQMGKREQEAECLDRGRRLQMGFKWHCYPVVEQGAKPGCPRLHCSTHFYCQ